jgi:hypothetical protein
LDRQITYSVDLSRLLRLSRKAKRKEHCAQGKTKEFFIHRISSQGFLLPSALLTLTQIMEQGVCRSKRITLNLDKVLN